MVSKDSHSNSNSSIMHQFIISNSIPNQTHFDLYGTDSVSNNTPYHSLLIQSLGERMSTSRPSDESVISHDSRLIDLLGPSNRQRLDHAFDFSYSGNAYGPSCNNGLDSLIGKSKYLRPAQSLLEEIVRVGGEDIDVRNTKYVEKLSSGSRKGHFGLFPGLLLSDHHETYINLLKLLALMEEVERRYEEYIHHMEELVSSFEVIAGLGAAKSYTAFALYAISKHFWSLRNTILSQIRAKIEKNVPKISSRLSQLSLLDQEFRQNRVSLQQLGILQNRQAWRPIRGLPETSVTILRAWLFEHFLHPYPNDSEKLMLASQTSLSKNQVSNWFINARVRLWKPMIEEMYKEEFEECSTESNRLLTRESADDLLD